jgi:hypothetical protein
MPKACLEADLAVSWRQKQALDDVQSWDGLDRWCQDMVETLPPGSLLHRPRRRRHTAGAVPPYNRSTLV